MTVLGDALIEMFDALVADAGGTVSVTRGLAAPVNLSVVRGRAFTERFGTDDGFYGTAHQDDFIVKASDYITLVGGEPDVHDVIEWTDDNANVRKYQVGVDGLDRQYTPVGQFGLLYRIHTSEIPAA